VIYTIKGLSFYIYLHKNP